MDIPTLTKFFMWCSLINAGILTLWTIVFLSSPDFVYKMQSRMFQLTREQFNGYVYQLIGFYKIVFIVFNLVPFLALKLMG